LREVHERFKRGIYGYLGKGIQTLLAQGRSTKIISMIKWIRTSRLSIKNSLFKRGTLRAGLASFQTFNAPMVYHSALGLRVIKKKKISGFFTKEEAPAREM